MLFAPLGYVCWICSYCRYAHSDRLLHIVHQRLFVYLSLNIQERFGLYFYFCPTTLVFFIVIFRKNSIFVIVLARRNKNMACFLKGDLVFVVVMSALCNVSTGFERHPSSSSSWGLVFSLSRCDFNDLPWSGFTLRAPTVWMIFLTLPIQFIMKETKPSEQQSDFVVVVATGSNLQGAHFGLPMVDSGTSANQFDGTYNTCCPGAVFSSCPQVIFASDLRFLRVWRNFTMLFISRHWDRLGLEFRKIFQNGLESIKALPSMQTSLN